MTEPQTDFSVDPEGLPHPEADPGIGSPLTWVRFTLLLILVAAPLLFLFRAGSRQVGGTITVPGHLTLGHEVRSFRPCSGGAELWIVGSPEVLGLLAQDHERVAGRSDDPYEPVFAVLMGEELPRSEDGFAAEYDGRFRVVGIDRLAPLSAEDCPGS